MAKRTEHWTSIGLKIICPHACAFQAPVAPQLHQQHFPGKVLGKGRDEEEEYHILRTKQYLNHLNKHAPLHGARSQQDVTPDRPWIRVILNRPELKVK